MVWCINGGWLIMTAERMGLYGGWLIMTAERMGLYLDLDQFFTHML